MSGSASLATVGHSGGGTTFFAVAGFVIAIVALGWQVYAATLQRPRLIVLLRGTVFLRTTAAPAVPRGASRLFRIVVVNHGRAALTIDDVGLRTESKAFANLSVQQMRDSGLTIRGPDLPCRVEEHGSAKWEIDGTVVVQRLADTGDAIYSWAEYFTSTRRHARDRLRRIGQGYKRSKLTTGYPR